MSKLIFCAVPFAVASSAALADTPTLVSADNRALTFGVFAVLFLLTLGITWYAARRNSTASDFYTAGGNDKHIRAFADKNLRTPAHNPLFLHTKFRQDRAKFRQFGAPKCVRAA